jgi:hypothetical protein
MRPVKGQYQVSVMLTLKSDPGELSGNILKFLGGKELIQFKVVSNSAKSAFKDEMGLIFNAIGEQLEEIIKKHWLRSVPNKHKFKIRNWARIWGQPGMTGHVVRTTKRYVSIICKENVFKVDAGIMVGGSWGWSILAHTLGRLKK